MNADLRLYFEEKILINKEYYNIDISKLVIDYLIDMTSEFALSNALFSEETTLFDLYKSNNFKQLADYSLFVSGCFTEKLLSKINLFNYYVMMSKNSYGIIRQEEKIYSEIYESFDNCLLIINGLPSNDNENDKIYKLYNLYKETNNYLIKKRLTRIGILMEISE